MKGMLMTVGSCLFAGWLLVGCSSVQRPDERAAVDQIKDDALQVEASSLVSEVRELDFKYPVKTSFAAVPHSLKAKSLPAYYSEAEKTLYLKKGKVLERQTGACYRATARALLDQNFNLAKLLGQNIGRNQDAELALKSLINGDTAVVMNEVLKKTDPNARQMTGPRRQGGRKFKQDLRRDADRRKAFFSIKEGSIFIKELKKSGGWAKVNQAYRNPPQSTEQILHPDKYLKNEAPRTVTLPIEKIGQALGKKWKHVKTNVLGELGILLLLSRQPATEAVSVEAAAGWGGDQMAVFRLAGRKSTIVKVIKVTWDSKKDADEFYHAYKKLIVDVYGVKNAKTKETKKVFAYYGKKGVNYIQKKGKITLVIHGPKVEIADAVFDVTKLR